jgi:thioredoxin 1
MNRSLRLGIVGAVVLLGLLAFLLRRGAERDADDRRAAQPAASEPAPVSYPEPFAVEMPIAPAAPAPVTAPTTLPRLVDVGAGTCIPCKMMAPILEELGREYAGVLRVDVYDLRQDRAPATQYGVRVIPTQSIFDAAGREVFRHEGFFAKEDILAKWRELGVTLPARPPAARWG